MGKLLIHVVCCRQNQSSGDGSCALKEGEQLLLAFEINTKIVIIEGPLDITKALVLYSCEIQFILSFLSTVKPV